MEYNNNYKVEKHDCFYEQIHIPTHVFLIIRGLCSFWENMINIIDVFIPHFLLSLVS